MRSLYIGTKMGNQSLKVTATKEDASLNIMALRCSSNCLRMVNHNASEVKVNSSHRMDKLPNPRDEINPPLAFHETKKLEISPKAI